MPPANSPTGIETPARSPGAASPYMQQLEAISSPVPNFAATLITQPGGNADNHDNMSYLRLGLPNSPDRQHQHSIEDHIPHYTSESRRRLLRNIDMLRRIPPPEERGLTSNSTYTNWAPGSEEEDDDRELHTYGFDTLNESRDHLSRMRNVQRTIDAQRTARNRPRREPRDEPSGRNTSTLPYWAESLRNDSASPRPGESSSATAALLQSVERHRRYNARARSTMQGFILDRDRLNHESSSREPTLYSRLHRSEHSRGASPYHLIHGSNSHADLRAVYHQLFLNNPSLGRLKSMIKYLSQLRQCTTTEEGMSLAADLNIHTLYSSSKSYTPSDLILETSDLKALQLSSWLMSGTVFTGTQHAPQESPAMMLNRDREHLQRIIASRNLDASESVPSSLLTLANAQHYAADLTQEPTPNITTPSRSLRHVDQWPVRVTIDSVDLTKMTLTGTMWASQIPDKLSPLSPDHKPEGTSMQSYFEGEIIDFHIHSLETENFRSDGVETDVTHWRQIVPFRELCEKMGEGGEEEMVRCLGSRDWVENVLGQQWVLMRWKERCFVTPSDSRWALTISGFYYIALRRDTGQIDGLYYDPGSQPYQQLSMKPEGSTQGSTWGGRKRWFPGLEFR